MYLQNPRGAAVLPMRELARPIDIATAPRSPSGIPALLLLDAAAERKLRLRPSVQGRLFHGAAWVLQVHAHVDVHTKLYVPSLPRPVRRSGHMRIHSLCLLYRWLHA